LVASFGRALTLRWAAGCHVSAPRLVVVHLGYPEYFLVMIGLGKWLAGLAMVAPVSTPE
jgi:hypothetical protein